MNAAQTVAANISLVGDLEEVVSFVKASTSRADELLRLICNWGENNKKELEEDGELVSTFTRLLGCIDVADLTQSAVDEFPNGFSYFGHNVDCELVFSCSSFRLCCVGICGSFFAF